MSNLLQKKLQSNRYGVKFRQEGEGQKFDQNELAMISKGEVTISEQTGNLQIKMYFAPSAGGGYCFYGLNRASQLALGDTVDFSKMKVYTYARQEWDAKAGKFIKHTTDNMLEEHLTPEVPEDED